MFHLYVDKQVQIATQTKPAPSVFRQSQMHVASTGQLTDRQRSLLNIPTATPTPADHRGTQIPCRCWHTTALTQLSFTKPNLTLGHWSTWTGVPARWQRSLCGKKVNTRTASRHGNTATTSTASSSQKRSNSPWSSATHMTLCQWNYCHRLTRIGFILQSEEGLYLQANLAVETYCSCQRQRVCTLHLPLSSGPRYSEQLTNRLQPSMLTGIRRLSVAKR